MSKKQDNAPAIQENHDPKKNIFQRMIEVQKLVTSVDKNETVKMHENDRGYKAVTHDDVAAALHLPLAQCGVFMLPDIEKYETSSFDKVNQYGKSVTWYRTDIEIKVQWINVDKPEEFITSKGAAFALDTSDKSFAKAYSLALKIVLLKVHLLESRDGEEQRPFDEQNNENKKGKGNQNQDQNNNQQSKPQGEQKPKDPVSPKDVVMPFGQAQGKKLGDLDTATLEKAAGWLKSEMAKDPKPKNIKQIAFIYAQVKAVLIDRNPPPPQKDDIPENMNQSTGEVPPEDESQLFPPDDTSGPSIDDYMIPKGILPALDGIAEIPLKKISEKELRAVQKILDDEMKKGPKSNISTVVGFEIRNKITEFFKSMGV